ncbi:tRNA (guanosine(18)-2'-O)-methyltransferase TrmH [Alteromonas oceanisediminis]|uniref:tRNA (guanosine(18)-2'-O)-methyltransferase TrmH n=1 Tax=Alteromonas oceanisediminis TaxID=2836180 RepID=UPI001BDB2B41|nr:tRNA (guanosine(18)-2'-O)-methyltransferase TrmH [Alteromonas oceanisediminis]MBT0586805.1 tRNA (guanosine(18)-2'-O)-methyltransferase TrmH [Alteromonas oceanisediminis]
MSAERNARIRELLKTRQPDLTVCLEEVHKPHNVAAVVRSCDAVGIHEIHGVWSAKNATRKGTSMGSQVWVKQRPHASIGDAVNYLKGTGMQILVTNLSDSAVDFRDVDYTKPTAIILGQEKSGATEEAIALADTDIVIPMVGMVQSLNVSVAGALVLYEAQRQRTIAGLYDTPRLSETECQRVLFEGGFPRLHKVCARKKMGYPRVDDEGRIVADEQWWQQMQMSVKEFAKTTHL